MGTASLGEGRKHEESGGAGTTSGGQLSGNW